MWSAVAAFCTTDLVPLSTKPLRLGARGRDDVFEIEARLFFRVAECQLLVPSMTPGRIESFTAFDAPRRNAPPPSTTLARYGSTTRPLPNASINSIVSIGPPPKPPSASANGNASQPRSANDFQWSFEKPGSASVTLTRASSE